MKRGDIILITVPFSDLTSTKVRPALVVSPENPAEGDFVVALITTNIDRALQPSDHALKTTDENFSETGLRFDSMFRMAKFFTLKKVLAQRKIGESVARAYEKT